MTEQEIKDEFYKIINTRGAGTKLGLTKFQVSNYKKVEPTVGTMLEVLWRANKIEMTI